MVDTRPSAFANDATPDLADVVPWVDIDGGGPGIHVPKNSTWQQVIDFIKTQGDVLKVKTATQTNTTVTLAAITDLSGTSLVPGTYRVGGHIIWQSAATTTGISLHIRGTGGTVTMNVGHWYHLTTGGAATTGIADQDTAGVTAGQMIEGRGWRLNTADPGACLGVDTANAHQLAVIECDLVVTATTTLDVMFRSEVAASGVTIQAGSNVKIEKVA